MSLQIQINIGDFGKVRVYLQSLGVKLTPAILNAAEAVLNDAAKLASGITHQGSTRRLHDAWVVSRTANKVSLTNVMPYANREFTRGGNKIRGNAPLGPHDPLPRIIDLINANLLPSINRASTGFVG
jgi:hypothetical protein